MVNRWSEQKLKSLAIARVEEVTELQLQTDTISQWKMRIKSRKQQHFLKNSVLLAVSNTHWVETILSNDFTICDCATLNENWLVSSRFLLEEWVRKRHELAVLEDTLSAQQSDSSHLQWTITSALNKVNCTTYWKCGPSRKYFSKKHSSLISICTLTIQIYWQ